MSTDQICQAPDCDTPVPAGTPQHQIVGPRPMCELHGKQSQQAWLEHKRRGAAHNARLRELEQMERDAFTSEGGALGALYECAQCGEGYSVDRPHFHTHPTTQHLCDTCEHIYWTVSEYQYNLRRDHGQRIMGAQPRAKRGLGMELKRAQLTKGEA